MSQFSNNSENKKEGVNEGTRAKASLQLRALEFMKKYGENKTLEIYAELLCWDLNTTKRTALDSYVLPMLRHGYIIYINDNKYSFIGNGKENKQIKKGKIDKEEKTQLQKDIDKHEEFKQEKEKEVK